MTTVLHEERLGAVLQAVRDAGVESVADLGCGAGDLFLRLAQEPGIARLVGVDVSAEALARLRARLARILQIRADRCDLWQGSVLTPDARLARFDCVTLIEVIEHLSPADLPRMERAIFATIRPRVVIVTTPNAEFNPLLGVPAHRFRHPGHRFEWTRAQFRRWSERTALSGGYGVAFRDLAGCHPDLGGASQMAVFTRRRQSPSGS
ncbi:MAG: methyltransferase domain-containing protein [Rubellimicrobium sp.]|nr:methyltransferase domain-containing protein [Rubellimicrobium sp.]